MANVRTKVAWLLAFAVAAATVFAVLYGDAAGWGPGLTFGVALGSLAAAATAYVVWERVRSRRRRAATPSVATSLGLLAESSGGSPLPPLPALSLTTGGTDHRAENVMSGRVGDGRVWVFDYSYRTEHTYTDSTGRTRTMHRDHDFSCALVELPAALPALRMAREKAFSGVAGRLGFGDIKLGDREFDRRFNIETAAPQVASELIDPSVRQWLLSLEDAPVFEVANRWLVAYDGQRRMEELGPLLDSAVGLRDHLPRQVMASERTVAASRRRGAVLPKKVKTPFLAQMAMFVLVMAATTMAAVSAAAFTELEKPELGALLAGGAGVAAILAVVVPLWARSVRRRRLRDAAARQAA